VVVCQLVERHDSTKSKTVDRLFGGACDGFVKQDLHSDATGSAALQGRVGDGVAATPEVIGAAARIDGMPYGELRAQLQGESLPVFR